MRRTQTQQRRSQRGDGGRPYKSFGRTSPKSFGRTSCPKGTHPMPDGSCMRGAYHGAPSNGGQQVYQFGIQCDGADGGGYSVECDNDYSYSNTNYSSSTSCAAVIMNCFAEGGTPEPSW